MISENSSVLVKLPSVEFEIILTSFSPLVEVVSETFSLSNCHNSYTQDLFAQSSQTISTEDD